MGRSYRVSCATCLVGAGRLALALVLSLAGTAHATITAQDAASALERAGELAARHRYQEVVDLLQPLLEERTGGSASPEAVFELGRAYFHLGRYDQAYGAFKRATEARPSSTDGLEYLEASAYLLDRRDEALKVLERILASGRTDLVLALTLPGERAFLSDPEVWRVLDRHARRLDISLVHATVMGVGLGAPRAEIEQALSDVPRRLGDRGGTEPDLLRLRWDADDRFAGLILRAEDLLRYTPYRLSLDHGLGWGSAPDEVVERYGAPTSFVPETDGGVLMTWAFPGWSATLGFGPPRSPRPAPIGDNRAMLRRVELRRVSPAAVE